MAKQLLHTQLAVLLRSVDYGDKDRIVTFLMKDEGKRTCMAKGGKVSVKRFGGSLELFRSIEVTYRESRKDNAMAILTETTVVEDFRGIEASFDKIAFGSYATELTREMLRDNEGHGEVHEALVGFYRQLNGQQEHAARIEADLQAFILRLLQLSGFAPSLGQCYRCGLAIDQGQKLLFARFGEGALCEDCREPGQQTIATSAHILSGLNSLAAGYPDADSSPSVSTLRQSRQLIFSMVRSILTRELRSYPTLKMVMA